MLDIENYRSPGGIDASPALAYPDAVDGFPWVRFRRKSKGNPVRIPWPGGGRTTLAAPRPLKPELPPQL
jgi:hypothetical protein